MAQIRDSEFSGLLSPLCSSYAAYFGISAVQMIKGRSQAEEGGLSRGGEREKKKCYQEVGAAAFT